MTTESDMPGTDDLLAAEYVLGLLDGDERRAAEAQLRADADFARAVRGWEIRFAPMFDGVEPVDAGAALRRRVLAATIGEDGAEDSAIGRLRARLLFWRGLALAATAATVVLAALLLVPSPAPVVVPSIQAAEITTDNGAFRYLIVLDTVEKVVQVTRITGTAPEGRVLQVWGHGPDEPASSIGLFGTGETARMPLPEGMRDVRDLFTFGISEEPPGGSPTGRPSGRVFGTVDIPL